MLGSEGDAGEESSGDYVEHDDDSGGEEEGVYEADYAGDSDHATDQNDHDGDHSNDHDGVDGDICMQNDNIDEDGPNPVVHLIETDRVVTAGKYSYVCFCTKPPTAIAQHCSAMVVCDAHHSVQNTWVRVVAPMHK